MTVNWRRVLLGCVIVSVSTSSMAFSCRPYVGAGFGSDPARWKFERALSASTFANYNMGQSLQGTQWTAYGGCELDFSRFLLGIEASGGTSTSEYRYSAVGRSTFISANQYQFAKSNISIAALPGVHVNGQSLYGRVGAQWTRFKYTTSDQNDTPPLTDFQFEQYADGLIAGLGVSAPIGNYFAIRNEYDHTFYKTIRKLNGTSQLTWMPGQDTYWLGISLYLTGDNAKNETTFNPLEPGFYIGAGIGRNVVRMKNYYTDANANIVNDNGLAGVVGQMLVGYDWQLLNKLNLGAEFTASYSSAKYINEDRDTTNSYYQERLHNYYALTGRVGVNTASSNMLFAVGGAVIGNFVRIDERPTTEVGIDSFDTNKWGFVAGIGDELALTKHLSYRIEGDYMRFNTIRGTDTSTSRTGGMKWTPTNQQVTVSLVYHM